MDYSSAQVQFRYDSVREGHGTRDSFNADRASKYSTASEGDNFESATEGSDTEDEQRCLSFPRNEITPSTPTVPTVTSPQGVDFKKVLRTQRTQSVTSQTTVRLVGQYRHTPMDSSSSDPFKSPVDPFITTHSRSSSTAEIQSLPPSTEHIRSRSLSNIRGPTPPVASRGKPSLPDVAIQRSSSFNIGSTTALDNSSGPMQIAVSRMRPVTAVPTAAPSVRETFSSPPPFSRISSYASVVNVSGGGSGTSTPSIVGHHSTAASSALALTAYIPGLGGHLSICDRDFHSPNSQFSCDGDDLKKDFKDRIMDSTLLQTEIPKPWLNEKDWRITVGWWLTVSLILLGFASGGFLSYWDYKTTQMITQPLCLVMEDDFDTFSVDAQGATWTREVDLSGFGNGEFEIATNSPNNSFVQDGMLYILPTLTELSIPGGENSIFNGYTLNLTGCTNEPNFEGTACGAVSNATTGTIINPVMSARLSTVKSHSIRYGKVEIRAKIPTGDWLWPALWMLPTNNTYGPWPLSGEIDIMESRGNGLLYPAQGSNVVRGTLNWGPTAFLNTGWRTFGFWTNRRQSFANDFHVYTLEWTPTFIRTYVDTRLHKMMDLSFNEPFFKRGKFPDIIQNGSSIIALQDPWIGRPNSAPFDQSFYLIMDVAVGGTNGWFPDGVGGKPWVDQSNTALRDFAKAQDQWYPTWPADPQDRAMVVDYVKMWQLC